MLEGVLFASAMHRMAQADREGTSGRLASRIATDVRSQNEFIRCDIEKLFMVTEALWTILKEQHGYSDEDLVTRIQEIDLRDGKLDGQVAKAAERPSCPHCGRKLMGRRPVCLYCGTEVALDPFER